MMKKILLVEDTASLAGEISDLLQMEGFKVSMAAHGGVALTIIDEFFPDLIITDLLMPEIDGFRLIELLKSQEHLRHIPIMVLSAKTDEQTIERVKSFGVNDFVTKPCKRERLLNAIQNIFNRTTE